MLFPRSINYKFEASLFIKHIMEGGCNVLFSSTWILESEEKSLTHPDGHGPFVNFSLNLIVGPVSSLTAVQQVLSP